MKGKKILVVPLNWGLGHATRIIPIIKILQNLKADIFISGSPEHISLLKNELPELSIVHLPYLKLKLGKPCWQLINYLIQAPRFFQQIRAEHKALTSLIDKEHFDLIISDNCYGLWNEKVKSVIITHQLNLQVPRQAKILLPLFNSINSRLIKRFSACWVPDFPDSQNLSGLLSHPVSSNLKVSYIGILSRFTENTQQVINNPKKKILCIISGPETQRTRFEEVLKEQALKLGSLFDFTFIRGLPTLKNDNLSKGWHNHVSTEEMRNLIIQSDLVICRSGYTSIMDLVTLKKPAIIVPTPGQPEQEYLARYLDSKSFFISQSQNKIDLLKSIEDLEKTKLKLNQLPKSNLKEILDCELRNILMQSSDCQTMITKTTRTP